MKWGLNQKGPLQDFRQGGHGNSRQKLRVRRGSYYICQNKSPPLLHPIPGQDVSHNPGGSPHTWQCTEATQNVQWMPWALGSLRPWKWP